jgi:hypothetical protein
MAGELYDGTLKVGVSPLQSEISACLEVWLMLATVAAMEGAMISVPTYLDTCKICQTTHQL